MSKTHHIHVILTEEMAEQLSEDAKKSGLSKSAFIRALLLMYRQQMAWLDEREQQKEGSDDQ